MAIVALNILDVKNSMHQLNALPIGEGIDIIFSAKPSLIDAANYIKVVELGPKSSSIDFPTSYSQTQSQLQPVELNYTYRFEASQHIVHVAPISPLKPLTKYFLYVNKSIYPDYVLITKQVTLGASSISVDVSPINNSVVSAEYVLEITAKSSLSAGKHLVGYKLSKDGVVGPSAVIDINSSVIATDGITSIRLSNKVPFLVGEKFSISTSGFTRPPEDKIQAFTTRSEESIKTDGTSDGTSSQITMDDLAKFYKTAIAPEDDVVVSAGYQVEIVHPDRIVINFDKPIDKTTVVESSFNIDFDYAFENYMLSKMGYYDENVKYVVSCKVSNTRIVLRVKEDTENIVPLDKKYIMVIT